MLEYTRKVANPPGLLGHARYPIGIHIVLFAFCYFVPFFFSLCFHDSRLERTTHWFRNKGVNTVQFHEICQEKSVSLRVESNLSHKLWLQNSILG